MARPAVLVSRVSVVVLALSVFFLLWSYALPQPHANTPIPAKPEDVKPEKPKPKSTYTQSFQLGTTIDHVPVATTSPAPEPEATSTPTKAAESEDGKEEAEPTATPSPTLAEEPKTPPVPCEQVPGSSSVMLVLKTSALDMYSTLPAHLLTLFRCAPHTAIFSDHSGSFAGFKVHDALQNISQSTRDANEEFKIYDAIKELQGEYQSLEVLKGEGAKELDKWKFLPMLYNSYMMNPGIKFYFFLEADTSLSWANLLIWLARLDARIPYYAGAPTHINNIKFAQRGSGFLISNAAMKLFATLYERRHSEWEMKLANECCGDLMVAVALAEAHVEFYSAFPLLQGERPSTLDWSRKHWCAPVVSWHHMSPEEIDLQWRFQEEWVGKNGWSSPYLYGNLFSYFISPFLSSRRTDWDNLSQDATLKRPPNLKTGENKDWYELSEDKKNATMSVDACEALCNKHKDCLQWRFKKDECALGTVARLGQRKGLNEGGKRNQTQGNTYTSGWLVDRIGNMVQGWGLCEEPKWRFNQ